MTGMPDGNGGDIYMAVGQFTSAGNNGTLLDCPIFQNIGGVAVIYF